MLHPLVGVLRRRDSQGGCFLSKGGTVCTEGTLHSDEISSVLGKKPLGKRLDYSFGQLCPPSAVDRPVPSSSTSWVAWAAGRSQDFPEWPSVSVLPGRSWARGLLVSRVMIGHQRQRGLWVGQALAGLPRRWPSDELVLAAAW